jgi:hypothetical protein
VALFNNLYDIGNLNELLFYLINLDCFCTFFLSIFLLYECLLASNYTFFSTFLTTSNPLIKKKIFKISLTRDVPWFANVDIHDKALLIALLINDGQGDHLPVELEHV